MYKILILLTWFLNFHDFHVSRTEVAYNSENSRFEISMHVFADDVLSSLDIDVIALGDSLPQREIVTYLIDHFSIATAGEEITLDFLGMEETEDFMGIWLYFQSAPVDLDNELVIDNSILTRTFADQTNMLSLTLGSQKEKYFLFNSSTVSKTIEIK